MNNHANNDDDDDDDDDEAWEADKQQDNKIERIVSKYGVGRGSDYKTEH